MALVRCSPELLAELVFKHHPTAVRVAGAFTDEATGDILIRVDGLGIPEVDGEVGYWVEKQENWAGHSELTGEFRE